MEHPAVSGDLSSMVEASNGLAEREAQIFFDVVKPLSGCLRDETAAFLKRK